MSVVQLDFTGIGKEQAHGHELALDIPAAVAEVVPSAIVTENIPIVKREFPGDYWYNWGIPTEEREKRPYNPKPFIAAKPNDPATCGKLHDAIKNVSTGKAKGIGYLFTGNGLCGIDLDHAIDPQTGNIVPWAKEILSELDTYTEISPSGSGFHIIAKAQDFRLETGRKKKMPNPPEIAESGMVEIYTDERYFTITANVFAGRDTIKEQSAAVLSVFNRLFADKPAAKPQQEQQPQKSQQMEIDEAIERKAPEYERRFYADKVVKQTLSGEYNDRSDNAFVFGQKYAYWMLQRAGSWTDSDVENAFQIFKAAPVFSLKYSANDDKLRPNGRYPTTIHRNIEGGFASQFTTAREKDRANPQPLLKKYGSALNTERRAKSTPDLSDYTDIVVSANGSVRPAETLENFKICIAKRGIKVGYNCLSREIIPPTEYIEQYSPVAIKTALLSKCQDFCAQDRIPKNRDRVAGWLSVVADENRVHPVQQYLEKLPAAKGETEIKRLFACLELAESASKGLSYKLLRKWLVQCVAMAYNDAGEYGAEGVLILQGAQGIGKTSFFRALCKDLKDCFKEGAEQNEDKDKIIENTKYWITELGELERSTLKEMGSLKAFITATSDEYRAPYAAVSVKYPRYTSLCGTVNELDFLREDGRRWWIIALEDINLDALAKISTKRLWAEAFALWNANKNGFRLTKEEQREVIKLSSNFEKRSTEEQVLLDRLNFEEKESLWHWRTTTEITQQLGLPDAVRVGRALKKITYGEKGEALTSRRYKGSTQYFVPPYITPSYQ